MIAFTLIKLLEFLLDFNEDVASKMMELLRNASFQCLTENTFSRALHDEFRDYLAEFWVNSINGLLCEHHDDAIFNQFKGIPSADVDAIHVDDECVEIVSGSKIQIY